MNLTESRQLVRFINVKNCVIKNDKPTTIFVEFIVDPEVTVILGKDWVAIYPKDSNLDSPIDRSLLDQMITFENIIHRPVNKEEKKYKLDFKLCRSNKLQFGQEYKFVYSNVHFEILGVSEAFKIFDLNREVESLQHDLSNVLLREESNNYKNPLSKLNQRPGINWKGMEVVESLEDKIQEVNLDQQLSKTTSHNVGFKNVSNQNSQFLNKVYPPYIQESRDPLLSPRCFSANNSCNNCSRVGSLLSSQSELYMQVKNLAEEKVTLLQKISCLEKQVELGQAAYQKQSLLLMQEREMRINYQREVEMWKSYQEESVHETPRNQVKTCKTQVKGMQYSQLMRLKAIIGNQEKKLCHLTEKLLQEEQNVLCLTQKLAEVQGVGINKVKIVEKEVEAIPKKVWSENQSYNNNDGEETSDVD